MAAEGPGTGARSWVSAMTGTGTPAITTMEEAVAIMTGAKQLQDRRG
ncbi:MAG: hypothetical protein ACRDP9_20695 [Kribbellaceae bacterium]